MATAAERRRGSGATTSRIGLLVALIAVIAGALGFGAQAGASSGDEAGDIVLTFDWPLDCPVEVIQTYTDGDDSIVVGYDVSIVERPADSWGRLLVEFSEPTLLDGDSEFEHLGVEYFANPSLGVTDAGVAARIVDFDGWFENYQDAGGSADDLNYNTLAAAVGQRLVAATWNSWVPTWSSLGSVPADGEMVLDDAPYLNDRGLWRNHPLTVQSVTDGDTVLLVAERELTAGDLAEVWREDIEPTTGNPAPGPANEFVRYTTLEVVTDPSSLEPSSARYEVSVAPTSATDQRSTVSAYEWEFDWTFCPLADEAESVLDLPEFVAPTATTTAAPPSTTTAGVEIPRWVPDWMDIVTLGELPDEALYTLSRIDAGGPFDYRQDDSVFQNREGVLPDRRRGHYREYTVETPGSRDRGARRIVAGADGELYYTDDHYDTFRAIVR